MNQEVWYRLFHFQLWFYWWYWPSVYTFRAKCLLSLIFEQYFLCVSIYTHYFLCVRSDFFFLVYVSEWADNFDSWFFFLFFSSFFFFFAFVSRWNWHEPSVFILCGKLVQCWIVFQILDKKQVPLRFSGVMWYCVNMVWIIVLISSELPSSVNTACVCLLCLKYEMDCSSLFKFYFALCVPSFYCFCYLFQFFLFFFV